MEHRWTVFVFNNFVDSFAEDHINIVKVNAKAWRRLIWRDTFSMWKGGIMCTV